MDDIIIDDIKTSIQQMLNLNLENLIADPKWGVMNFEDARREIELFFSTLSKIENQPFEVLPEQALEEINESLNRVIRYIGRIKQFDVSMDNAKDNRADVSLNVKDRINKFLQVISKYIPFLTDLNDRSSFYSDKVAEFDRHLKDIVTIKEQSESALESIQQITGNVGIEKHAEYFNDEFEMLDKKALMWLITTIFLTATSLTFFWYFMNNLPPIFSTPTAIIYISSRIFIMSLMLAITFWCGNMYKIIKHQASANKFKANALRTFRTFVDASLDPRIKDVILVETTKAIFTEYSTGLVGKADENRYKPLNIVDLTKKFESE